MRDLGTLGGKTSRPFVINARGQAVGWAAFSGGGFRAALWEKANVKNLGTLGRNSFAFSINGNGVVVGSSHLRDGTSHAFVWNNAAMTDLVPSG